MIIRARNYIATRPLCINSASACSCSGLFISCDALDHDHSGLIPSALLPSLSNRLHLHAPCLSLVFLLGRCAAWCVGNALNVFSQLVVLRQWISIVTAALLRRQRVFLSEALVTHKFWTKCKGSATPAVGTSLRTVPRSIATHIRPTPLVRDWLSGICPPAVGTYCTQRLATHTRPYTSCPLLAVWRETRCASWPAGDEPHFQGRRPRQGASGRPKANVGERVKRPSNRSDCCLRWCQDIVLVRRRLQHWPRARCCCRARCRHHGST